MQWTAIKTFICYCAEKLCSECSIKSHSGFNKKYLPIVFQPQHGPKKKYELYQENSVQVLQYTLSSAKEKLQESIFGSYPFHTYSKLVAHILAYKNKKSPINTKRRLWNDSLYNAERFFVCKVNFYTNGTVAF